MAAATTEGMGNCKIVKFYAIKILAVKMGACCTWKRITMLRLLTKYRSGKKYIGSPKVVTCNPTCCPQCASPWVGLHKSVLTKEGPIPNHQWPSQTHTIYGWNTQNQQLHKLVITWGGGAHRPVLKTIDGHSNPYMAYKPWYQLIRGKWQVGSGRRLVWRPSQHQTIFFLSQSIRRW